MREAGSGQAEAGSHQAMENSEGSGGWAPGRLCLQKHQSSLLAPQTHTAKGAFAIFPVPAQAVVSVDLKSVPLPPKLKSFDKVKWKELGTRDYILYERKHPEEANLEKWTAR